MKIQPIEMKASTVLYLCAGWLGLLGVSLLATATCLTHYMIVITMGIIGMIIRWITRKGEENRFYHGLYADIDKRWIQLKEKIDERLKD